MNAGITSDRKKDFYYILILFLLVIVFFWKVVFLGECFTGGDIINQFYPWKYYLAEQTRTNHLPLWNPYTFGGNPFAANYQVGMWYPPDIIFYFLPIAFAFRISIVIHFFLAGLFMFILCRHFHINRKGSLASAIIFTFSGFMITRMYAGNYTLVTTVPWIPIIFYLFDKTIQSQKLLYLALFSIAISCQTLGGHPQPVYYTFLSLFLYAIFVSFTRWKEMKNPDNVSNTSKSKFFIFTPFVYYFIGILLAGGLSAIQLLPSRELFQFSASRSGGAPYDFATTSSLAFRHLLLFLAPQLFGIPQDDTYWLDNAGYVEICAYIGITTLFLVFFCLYSKKKKPFKFFSLLILVSFFLAFGRNNPVYPLFFNLIPGLKMFRCPARWLMMIHFGLAFIAGAGIHSLMETEQHSKKMKTFLWVVGILGCILFAGWIYIRIDQPGILNSLTRFQVEQFETNYHINPAQAYSMIPAKAMELRYTVIVNQISICFVLFALSLGLYILFYIKRISPSLTANLFIAIILLDLWIFGNWFVETGTPSEFAKRFQRSDGIQYLQQDKDNYRIISLDNVLSWKYSTEMFEYRPNRLMIHHIQETRGYDPTILKHYAEYLNVMQNLPLNFDQGGLAKIPDPHWLNPALTDLLNVKYICSMIPSENLEQYPLVFTGRVNIYRNKEFIPRAFFVPNAKVIPEENKQWDDMTSASFQPDSYIILDSKPKNIPDRLFAENTEKSKTIPESTITQKKFEPDLSEWDINLPVEGFIFFSEIWYPGWTVFANGKEIPVYKADHCFRAIYLPEGHYRIKMVFLPATYYWGKRISIIFLLIILIMISYYFFKKEKATVKSLQSP